MFLTCANVITTQSQSQKHRDSSMDVELFTRHIHGITKFYPLCLLNTPVHPHCHPLDAATISHLKPTASCDFSLLSLLLLSLLCSQGWFQNTYLFTLITPLPKVYQWLLIARVVLPKPSLCTPALN